VFTSDIAEGMVYAADNGAQIINMSFGGTDFSRVEAEALEYAHGRNLILIAGAGNNYEGSVNFFPANHYPWVLPVGASNPDKQVACFSNRAGLDRSITCIMSLRQRGD